MELPSARGPISSALTIALRSAPHDFPPESITVNETGDPLWDDDLQLALFICYELHYRGWDEVSDDWEWQPGLLALRSRLERRLEWGLRNLVGPLPGVQPAALSASLKAVVEADDGPSLAKYIQTKASLEQFREFVAHRSVYHLREADPHTWAIPRLEGQPKAALVEIQADEYGGGQLDRMHSQLFRDTMTELGMDATYGAYVEAVPAITLTANNLMSLFGLHRRWRGALLGHLAAFEMTSSLPNRRYGNGLRRLGGDAVATRFYDEHVEADAVHEQIAVHDMCATFVAIEPDLAADVVFGAGCALAADRLIAEHVLDCWREGRTSLRQSLDLHPDTVGAST
ncbi:MAG: iron-containing redox enzyme family protein [Longispora sp.]|nr:iron-containing redox enzyme family protein [Longispora sp. (in: high G+C Gram-positive bacteria)]